MTLLTIEAKKFLCFIACWFTVWLPTFAFANPSSRDPSKPLATHNTIPEAGQLASSLYAACAAVEKFVIQSEESLKQNGAEKLKASTIAQGLWKMEQGGRDANRLRIMGEPAGVDLGLRTADLSARLSALARAHAPTRPGLILSQKSMAFLERESPNRQRELARLSKLAETQKFAEMEKSLDKFGSELCSGYAYVSGYDLNKYYQPYGTFREQLETSKVKALQDAVDARYATLIDEAQPDPAAVLTWATESVKQLKTTGKVTIEGTGSMGGPELVDDLMKRWSSGHAVLQRIRGLRWAWARDIENQNAKMNTEIKQWNDTISQAFKMIVKADAEFVQPADVPKLHQQYLTRIASVMGLLESAEANRWKVMANESLASLLAKNSVYETSVKAYEASTRDLLAFQRRIAEQRQTSLEGEFPKSEQGLRQVAKAVEGTPGLYLDTPGAISTATLLAPADRIMATIGPKLTNSLISLDGVRSISPTSKVAAVRFNGRIYGRSLQVALPEDLLLKTKKELLIDGAYEPLSVEAAYAIKAMQSGDFAGVGGKVVAFQLEPLVTRLITMTEPAAVIVPHGITIDPTIEGNMLNQMTVQMDIAPSWVRTEIGFHELPTEGQGSPNK